jgi:hypothetical protein
MEYLLVLMIPAISALDFFRGNTWPIGWGGAKKGLLGLAMGFTMGFTQWELALATLLCAASFASGWGAALGAALRKDGSDMGPNYEHYWQSENVDKITSGLVRSNPLFAMSIRGVWGYMFLLPLAYFNPWSLLLLPVYALSFSLPTLVTGHWKRYECIRGALLGTGCVAIGYIGVL